MANLFDRAGMSTATSGSGTLALGASLGAVAPNLALVGDARQTAGPR